MNIKLFELLRLKVKTRQWSSHFGSSDKLVPGFMNSEDFEFEVFHISVSISASFKDFDFIV